MTMFGTQTLIKYLSFLVVTFALAACGGGGGSKSKTNSSQSLTSTPATISSANSSSSSNSSSSLASLAPTADILFPPQNAFTEGSSILVRGTASDADGSITSVSVNGVKATSTDAFATWSVKLPTQVGTHSLDVIVTDNTGVTNQTLIQHKIIHQAAQIRQPSKMALDKKNNRALVLDRSYNRFLSASIIAVDLTTGNQTTFSDNLNSEIKLMRPTSITVDEAGNRALILDTNEIIIIDLTTGERTLVKPGKLPGSTEELIIQQIAFDNINSKLWAATSSGNIINVDLLTGIPTSLDDAVTNNTAIEIPYIESMQIDPVNQRLLVASTGQDYIGLIGIDINTGDRTIISNQDKPNAVNMFDFASEVGIALDSTNNRIFAVDSHQQIIYEINSLTGARTLLKTPQSSDQFEITEPIDIFLDADRGRLIVLDDEINSLISISLDTKITSLITEVHTNKPNHSLYESRALTYDFQSDKIFAANYFSILAVDAGAGDRANLIKRSTDGSRTHQGLAYDPTKNILYYEEGYRVIEAVDLNSNNRYIVTKAGIPDFTNVPVGYSAIELDESKSRLIVADSVTAAIYSIDLATGKRSIISDNASPNPNNPMRYPLGMDLDLVNNRLFVADFSSRAIYQIDLNSGTRQLLSGSSIPNTDNALVNPRAVAYDSINNRLIVTDSGLRALVQVDIATGQRSIISSNLIPNSINGFSTPTGIQLDPEKNIAYVADRGRSKVLSVNLSTGERTDLFSVDSPEQFVIDTKNNRAIITSGSYGMYIYDFSKQKLSEYEVNPEFDSFTNLDFDSLNNRIIAVDEDEQYFAIDKSDSSITPLYSVHNADSPQDIVVDSHNQKLFILDSQEQVFTKNLTSLDEPNLLINFRATSTQEEINYIGGIAFLSSTNSLFTVGSNNEAQTMVWKVNISDRSLSVLYHDKASRSEEEYGSNRIVVDETRNRAFVLDDGRGSVTEISLADGSYKILSDRQTPNIFNPILETTSMTLDTKRNRLLISQYYVPGLLSVDLETGERIYVSR